MAEEVSATRPHFGSGQCVPSPGRHFRPSVNCSGHRKIRESYRRPFPKQCGPARRPPPGPARRDQSTFALLLSLASRLHPTVSHSLGCLWCLQVFRLYSVSYSFHSFMLNALWLSKDPRSYYGTHSPPLGLGLPTHSRAVRLVRVRRGCERTGHAKRCPPRRGYRQASRGPRHGGHPRR